MALLTKKDVHLHGALFGGVVRYPARVLDCEPGRVKVHYEGWPKRFDHWISTGSDSVRVNIKTLAAAGAAAGASATVPVAGPKTTYCL